MQIFGKCLEISTTYITIVSKAALLTYASYAHTLNKIGPFCEGIPVYPVLTKVIIEKSRGEGSLIGQDTIENVSEPKFFF